MNIQELRDEIKESFDEIKKELVELRKIQTQQAVTRNDVAWLKRFGWTSVVLIGSALSVLAKQVFLP